MYNQQKNPKQPIITWEINNIGAQYASVLTCHICGK